ncbi:MAG TPA: hypothetical protein VID27_06270 [Blastocatellia bacterium]
MKKAYWFFAVILLMALCWAGWSSRAQTASRWEYKVVQEYNHIGVNLDDFGAQGWELVAVETREKPFGNSRTITTYYYFKRQK